MANRSKLFLITWSKKVNLHINWGGLLAICCYWNLKKRYWLFHISVNIRCLISFFFWCIDQNRHLVDGKKFLDRNIRYAVNRDKTRCFPRDHVMEKTQSSRHGARMLMKEIFQDKDSKHLATGLRASVDIFVTFLKRHKSCPFKRLLDSCCPKEAGATKDVPNYKVL